MTDTGGMHFRRERVRIETQRHDMVGVLQLPTEGYRSRTTDFLNAHEREFLALTDVEVTWLDGSRPARAPRVPRSVGTRHVVMVIELEDLGTFDEAGLAPPSLVVASTPPPGDELARLRDVGRLARRAVRHVVGGGPAPSAPRQPGEAAHRDRRADEALHATSTARSVASSRRPAAPGQHGVAQPVGQVRRAETTRAAVSSAGGSLDAGEEDAGDQEERQRATTRDDGLGRRRRRRMAVTTA